MKLLINLCLIILFVSCNTSSNKPNLNSVLVNGCYWDILDKNSSPVANMCFQFNTDGTCQYFDYHFTKNKRTDTISLFYEDDNILPKTWSTQGDTIIIAQATHFPVLRYTADSIYTKFKTSQDTIILIKNCASVRRNHK